MSPGALREDEEVSAAPDCRTGVQASFSTWDETGPEAEAHGLVDETPCSGLQGKAVRPEVRGEAQGCARPRGPQLPVPEAGEVVGGGVVVVLGLVVPVLVPVWPEPLVVPVP